ncbi:alpha/beta-hydrolase [Delitschia confertaspora ATCC 74209]|uniref:Alpha/beta-hydrolase n=1 Tax=Delitschia confertaspora ATCC 74209 TaxID=1513339 RepID=A0A9P4JRU1_9PLEO|nr:alpha/beta-hydrolase [Delitschia confertaspora ATCC 74209]
MLPSTSSKSQFPPLPLPDSISQNFVYCPSNGLTFHCLEAGYTPERNKPLLLLLHGFPELAFTFRGVMPIFASAGYYVVAPDQRGFGRTTGWDDSTFCKTDLSQFTMTNLVRDMVILVHALGYKQVHCIIGHDFGALASSMCALMRPDMFRSVIMMSHPFKQVPDLPFNIAHGDSGSKPDPPVDIQRELAQLPEPRKHYKWYNATAVAAFQWSVPLQGMARFVRGFVHVKSADYEQNNPHPLKAWKGTELAKMPWYYIMPLHSSMPEVVNAMMEGEDYNKTSRWLTENDLQVYVQEWTRTGFQGGLNWYRSGTDISEMEDLHLFAGRKIECPAIFISGEKDWGIYQDPGVLENMPNTCSQFRGIKLIKGAGHWPLQEQMETVCKEVLDFVASI